MVISLRPVSPLFSSFFGPKIILSILYKKLSIFILMLTSHPFSQIHRIYLRNTRSENIRLLSPPSVCKSFQYASSKTSGCRPHKLGRSTAQNGLQLFHSIQIGYGVNLASWLTFTSSRSWTITYVTKWPKWMEFYRHAWYTSSWNFAYVQTILPSFYH